MLQKQNRLKRRSAFTATYKTGKSFHRNGITMFVGKENNQYPTKIGFVVSKKVHKRAVKRNRIKRLMRESVRIIIKNAKFSYKYKSIIFAASSKVLEKSFNEVDITIKELVSKL